MLRGGKRAGQNLILLLQFQLKTDTIAYRPLSFHVLHFTSLSSLNTKKINSYKIALAVSSGVLLTLSFPKAGIFWLAWFALVPLLIALGNLSPKNSFILGFYAGLIHYLTLIYWLAHTMKTYGHLPLYQCLPVLVLLSAYLALYPAVFSMLANRLCPTPLSGLITIPCLWVFLEYLRAVLFTGFPWELLGYTQFKVLPLIQIADILGVYGVSFCIVLGNVTVFLVILCLTGKNWLAKKVARRLAGESIAAFVIIFGLVWFYGIRQIQSTDQIASNAPLAKIAVVQGNIDQAVKWDPAFQYDSTIKYISLSLEAKKQKPDLVVWPETATPFYFLSNTTMSQMVKKGIHDIGADFLIGSPSFRSGQNGVEYYNSAYLVGAKGTVLGQYDKAHLVPFGEYIPFKKWLPFLSKMVAGVGDFHPGEKGLTIPWKNYSLGVQICYEIIFPQLSRAMTQNHAALLVNITNDAWYGRTSAPYQHFSMAVFRAVENRRSLVRSANTGISGFIDPAGRIIASTPIFEDALLTHTVPLLQTATYYSQVGDLFATCCLAVTLLSAIYAFLRNLIAIRPSEKLVDTNRLYC